MDDPREQPRPETVRDVTDSDDNTDPGLSGGMGVSSERRGATGPGQLGTTGAKDTQDAAPPEHVRAPEGDEPPEQRPGGVEDNPPTPPVKDHSMLRDRDR